MKISSGRNGRTVSMAAGIAWGTGIAMGLTCLMSLLVSVLVDRGILGEYAIGYGAMVILLVASISGAVAAKKRIRRRNILVVMVTGLCYFLCLLSMTALLFGGQYQGIGVTGLVILGGSGTVALMGMNDKTRGKGRRFAMPKYAAQRNTSK